MVTSYNFKLKSKLPIMFRLFSRFNYTPILVQIEVCWILQHKRTHSSVIRSMKVFYCAHGELLIILHMQRASEPCTTSHHHQQERSNVMEIFVPSTPDCLTVLYLWDLQLKTHNPQPPVEIFLRYSASTTHEPLLRIIMVVFLYRDMWINEEESIKNRTSWLMDAQFCV